MPQMSPMSWLKILILTLLIFTLFFSKINKISSNSFIFNKKNLKMLKKSWVW